MVKRLTPIAFLLVLALLVLPGRSADAQTPEELDKRVSLLEDQVALLRRQVATLGQQLAELRGPIRASATGVTIVTPTFTVEASKISLKSTGILELKGATITQN